MTITPTSELAERIAALIPSPSEPDVFAVAGKKMLTRFMEDVTERPESFLRTIEFMRSMDGRQRTIGDEFELARIYDEEATKASNNL